MTYYLIFPQFSCACLVDDRSRRSSQRREDRERDIRRHTLGSEVLHYSNQPQQMQRNMAGMDLEVSEKDFSIRCDVMCCDEISYLMDYFLYKSTDESRHEHENEEGNRSNLCLK